MNCSFIGVLSSFSPEQFSFFLFIWRNDQGSQSCHIKWIKMHSSPSSQCVSKLMWTPFFKSLRTLRKKKLIFCSPPFLEFSLWPLMSPLSCLGLETQGASENRDKQWSSGQVAATLLTPFHVRQDTSQSQLFWPSKKGEKRQLTRAVTRLLSFSFSEIRMILIPLQQACTVPSSKLPSIVTAGWGFLSLCVVCCCCTAT